MTVFTRAEVIATAKQLVEEAGPGYIYPGSKWGNCSYQGGYEALVEWDDILEEDVETGEQEEIPACLIGQIINRLDPSAYQELCDSENGYLPSARDFSPSAAYPTYSNFTEAELAVCVIIDTGEDAELALAMRTTQYNQDQGQTWTKAIEPLLALEQ